MMPGRMRIPLRRNFLLGVANGVLGRFFRDLTDPALVLTWFVSGLGASALLIGLLQPVSRGAGFVAQMLTSGRLQALPRKMPAYRLLAVMRAVCWLLLVGSVLLIGNGSPSLLLAVFTLGYVLFSMLRGASALTFMDIVGKAIPSARRGTFFGWRQFGGAVLALAGTGLVGYVLDERRGLGFPLNFACLFAVAGLVGMVGWVCFALVIEPADAVRSGDPPPGGHVQRIGRILRQDHNFARFMLSMMALLISTVAMPFYTVFAKDQLGAPARMAGVYLAVFTAGSVGSTLLWGRLSDRRGSRTVLRLVGLLSVPVPVLSLLLGPRMSYLTFAPVFLLLGGSRSGFDIGYMGFVLDIAPAAETVTYYAVANTLLGMVQLLMMASGIVVQRWGLASAFVLSGLCALLSISLLGGVRQPRESPV